MNNIGYLFAALACASLACEAKPTSLTCPEINDDLTIIKKLAPDAVIRLSNHKLRVTTKNGTTTFTDSPPYDEPLSGVHYHLCDHQNGFILVGMEDETRSTGKLINEQTGAVTNAGFHVLISNDGRAYFSAVQPDGLDGEEWNIYTISGQLSWNGYSFIPQKNDPHRFYATLDHPSWLDSGEFTATASCASNYSIKWTVKLIKINEEWSWHPLKKCPPL